jgi:cyclophilin family peptidyl-prolyl cis-trans isomerase
MRRALALLVGFLLAALGCGREAVQDGGAAAAQAGGEALARIQAGPHDVAVIDMGELGVIRVELLREIAPRTVANFVELAQRGFYDGTYFHRVIPGFMVQGGDPATKNTDPRDDGEGGPGYTIEDEFGDYPHLRGTVSMANKGFPHSSASQFFIVQQNTPQLDGKYTAFGRVIGGIEVVDAITELELDVYGRYGPQNRPYPVNAVVRSLRIEPAGGAADRPTPAHAAR